MRRNRRRKRRRKGRGRERMLSTCHGGQHPRCSRGSRRETLPRATNSPSDTGGRSRVVSARSSSGCGPLSVTEGTRPSQPGTLLKQHTGECPPGSYGLSCRRVPLCASQESVVEGESGSDPIALIRRRHPLDAAPGRAAQSLEPRGWAMSLTGTDGREEEEEST